MVGALIALGQRKITENDITFMLQVPSHYNWNSHVAPVPSSGLHLVNLEYDQEELKRCTISEEQHQRMQSEKQHEQVQSKEQDRNLISKEEEVKSQELQLKR